MAALAAMANEECTGHDSHAAASAGLAADALASMISSGGPVVPPTLPGSRPMRCDSASFGPFSPPIQRFLGDAAWRRRGSSIGHGGLDRLSDAGGVLHLEGAHSAAAGATIPLESADSDLLRDLAVRQTAQIAALREQLRHRSDLRRYTTVYMGATAPAFLVPTDTSDGADRALRRLRASVEHYRGVRFCKKSLKWIASISHKAKVRRLGVFTSEELAARAYDAAAYEIIAQQPDVPARHQPKPNFTREGERIPYSRRTRRHDKVMVENVAPLCRAKAQQQQQQQQQQQS
ncbi:hypothetical protein FNF27_01608 [Cafeteria roenbergensis]|uniref:AP2/ERF domain-containing protein n=1 Tax=Cafeteria roenbergensis TaxID=33653 RepID=A0A5A8EG04_CAFRO|nr:hypothetical protein FNF27_01608 [Cafeteria roenbergensis]